MVSEAGEGAADGTPQGPFASATTLCFASDGAVVGVAAGDRSDPKAAAMLSLQGRLESLSPEALARLTGVKWQEQESMPEGSTSGSTPRHARSWRLDLGPGNSEFPDMMPPPTTSGTTAAGGTRGGILPGVSVDGAFVQLLLP